MAHSLVALADGTFPCGSFADSNTVTSRCFIRHCFTCLFSNLMYCISCNKCGSQYIGETGRSLWLRFGEHRRSVNNHDNTKPVSRHFTPLPHDNVFQFVLIYCFLFAHFCHVFRPNRKQVFSPIYFHTNSPDEGP